MSTPSKISLPLLQPEDVIPHLKGKELHWRHGYSAKSVCDSWFQAKGIPAAVKRVLELAEEYRGAELLDAWLERCTELPWGRGRPTQTDLLATIGLQEDIAILGIEAKVKESFGPFVSEWRAQGGENRLERLHGLCALFGLDPDAVGHLRYQLFHRVAGTVLEAQRYRAPRGAMLVQSFCPDRTGHADFSAFAEAAGFGPIAVGSISSPKTVGNVQLRIGWVADEVP